MTGLEIITANNQLSKCCIDKIYYSGGIKYNYDSRLFQKAPIKKYCSKCHAELGVVDEQNATQEELNLINY